MLCEGQTIPVQLVHEPTNTYDSQAIKIELNLNGQWKTIGYNRALQEVHKAISSNVITAIRLVWVKYITSWTYSRPGYFAGVKISKRGKWSTIAISCSSRR